MKKAIILLSALFVMVYGEHETQENMPICMSWKDAILMHWQSLSHIHKLLLTGLIAFAIVGVVWRVIKCGKNACGCHCGNICSCDKRT